MSVNEVKIQPAPFDIEVRGTGHPGSRTFAIGNEDHTLGNSIRHVLMNTSKVEFAGYSVPHPSEPVVHIRVQTSKSKNEQDRERASDVLKEACETLVAQCDLVIDQLEEVLPSVKKNRMEVEDILRQIEDMPVDEEEQDDDNFDDEMMASE
ncbi:hypothetical protein CTEN210_15180 [Chaetoceros tenuissimus]|jgi:DNA-directed RNA polymerase I and III subunit RPAC2|uniref:DNA-directed RNA polymerase RBP11-like dimerisation domain-containing protein n=1 Tax=Chaetoceros tenuissimus TaxID=426638 RepID=A0AAD3D6I7_9STRA|nr:hypothetical protein CTEN210_15180 [Chaetoceros tenuissimus]